MGGVHGGKIASSVAIDMVSDKIKKCYNKLMPVYSFENIFLSTITTANVIVNDRSYTDDELRGMGTTIVAVIVKNGEACIAHVGDSRAYHVTPNGIEQVTKDHSVVQLLVDRGEITADEARFHPKKHFITRALGVMSIIDLDYCEFPINEGEAIMVCTDGLSNFVSDQTILEIFKNS